MIALQVVQSSQTTQIHNAILQIDAQQCLTRQCSFVDEDAMFVDNCWQESSLNGP